MSDTINKILWDLIVSNTSEAEAQWLTQNNTSDPLDLMTAFVACPRILTKKTINVVAEKQSQLNVEIEGFSVQNWSLVRLARVWLLTQLDSGNRKDYIHHVTTLFDTAELNELVALYSALPVLAYPEAWLFRATDAVRSNMGFVFDAIAMQNPFPKIYFDEAAWNQLVMKTIFNDKPVHMIVGFKERSNRHLAQILSDFAHERWAAGRFVAPEVWRLASPFMNEILVDDMQHLFETNNLENQQAAALVCSESDFLPAKTLLTNYPELHQAINSGKLTWAQLETQDLNTYVPQP